MLDLTLMISPSPGMEDRDVRCPVDEVEERDTVDEEDCILIKGKFFFIPNPGDESTGDEVGETRPLVDEDLANGEVFVEEAFCPLSSLSDDEHESLM